MQSRLRTPDPQPRHWNQLILAVAIHGALGHTTVVARFRSSHVGTGRHSERQEGEHQEREVAAGHNDLAVGVVAGGLQLSRKVPLRVHR